MKQAGFRCSPILQAAPGRVFAATKQQRDPQIAVRADLSAPREATATRVEVWGSVAAVVLTAFYLGTTLYNASHSLLSFDEILTAHMARLANWETILKALRDAADAQPPGFYLIVRTFDHLFGHSEVALRLPLSLAMAVAMLLTFDCARRLTDSLHGLIAPCILAGSALPYYGYDARPYAIFVMMSALGLWVWSYTRDGEGLSPILFGVVFFFGVTIHYFFVLCLVPYALWEVRRWRPWRRPSPMLTAGLVGAAVPAALFSPLILTFGHRYSAGYSWGRPSFFALGEFYFDMLPAGLFLLTLIMAWIVLLGAEDKSVFLRPMQPAEAVGWLFACIPLVGFVLAEWKTNAFIPRYFVGTLPGIAVAFSCWLWRNFRNTAFVSLGVCLLLAAWGVGKQASRMGESPKGNEKQIREYLALEDSLRNDGKRYMVCSHIGNYMRFEYYSKHPEDSILMRPPDVTQEGPPGRGMNVAFPLSQYYPFHYWNLNDLKKHASETALIAPVPETVEALEQAGFQVAVRYSNPIEVLYLH